MLVMVVVAVVENEEEQRRKVDACICGAGRRLSAPMMS
jgi:hypothetical protein